GLREAGELVHRPFGLEASGAAGHEADERGALASAHACGAHASTSSHGIAPARTSRSARPVASTIVDGGPPGVGPPSSSRSTPSPSDAATLSGSSVADSPLTFALLPVSARPPPRHNAGAVRGAGPGRPTGPVSPTTGGASVAGAGNSSVSGPGQNRSASARAVGDSLPITAATCSTSAAISGSARPAPRPLIANTR